MVTEQDEAMREASDKVLLLERNNKHVDIVMLLDDVQGYSDDYDASGNYEHLLAIICFEIEAYNGFESTNINNFPAKLMLVVTELSEAQSFVDNGNGDHISEELADTAIRTMAMLHSLSNGKWNMRSIRGAIPHVIHDMRWRKNCSERFMYIIHHLSLAMEAWRKDNIDDVIIALELALFRIYVVAIAIDVNLNNEIWMKCHKNLSRAYLHGNVRTEG